MAYAPKNKYTTFQTSGGEYIDAATRQNYVGNVILTPQGAFRGKNINQIEGVLLRVIQDGNVPNNTRRSNFAQLKSTNLYHNLKRTISDRIGGTSYIYASKTIPTKKDYEKGHYKRYFCKRSNNQKYFEINKELFDGLMKSDNKYDYVLYLPGSLRWSLARNSQEVNSKPLLRLEKSFPGISLLFSKLNEFSDLSINPSFISQEEKIEIPYDGLEVLHSHDDSNLEPFGESITPEQGVSPSDLSPSIDSPPITPPSITPSYGGGGSSGGGGGGY